MNNSGENFKCPVCNAENAPDYKYCKNCGSLLESGEEKQNGDSQYTPPPNFSGTYNGGGNYYGYYGKPYTDYSAVEPELEGVDTKKIQAFVGTAKQDYFMQLFITMKRLGRKLFINWPIAILGALLATPFAASWFFYRKMHRIGIIICLSCLLLTGLTTAVTYSEQKAAAEDFITEISQLSDEELLDYIPIDDGETQSYTSAITYVIQLITLGGVVILALYGNYFYYKHTTSKIKSLDSDGISKDLFFYSMKGRPSLFTAIAVPLCFSILQGVISLTPYIEVMLSGFPAEKLLYVFSNL